MSNRAVEAMRQANLGRHRSQETKSKISESRKQMAWTYANVPSTNPSVGDKAKVNHNCCVWSACSICGNERWVRTKQGGVPIHAICNHCTTEETRQKLRTKELGKKHSPERVEKNRKAQTGKVMSDIAKKKISIANIGKALSLEARGKISKAQRLLWKDPSYKEKITAILAKPPTRVIVINNKPELVSIQKLNSSDVGDIGDFADTPNGKAIKVACELCGRTRWTRIEYGKPRSSLCHSCASKVMRIKYPKVFEEAKRKWMNAMQKSLHIRPNQAEVKLLGLLNDLYPGQWAFVGDWTLIIADKNPDFVNVNGKKQIIELFGDYWHKDDNPSERVSLFSEFGYKTLIIWEHELRDEEKLATKIREFSQ